MRTRHKPVKGAVVALSLVVALVVIAIGALWLFYAKPPAAFYGAGRYSLFKFFASENDCRALAELLKRGQPDEFNRYRTNRHLLRKHLRFDGIRVCGKDLRGVDLSRCVLRDCWFTGCDLTGASFTESYLAETYFYWPHRLEDYPTPEMARPTRLSQATFWGAQFQATVYLWNETGYSPFRVGARGLEYCDVRDTKDLPQIARVSEPLILTLSGFRVQLPKPDERTVQLVEVSIPCPNPFQSVPSSLYETWKDCGVDVADLMTKPARRLDWDKMKRVHTVANADSNTVLVVGGRSTGWPEIVSTGPVVLCEELHGLQGVFSDGILWLRDNAAAPVLYAGHPVIAGPHVSSGLDKALLSPVFREPVAGLVPHEDNWTRRLLADEPIEEVARRLARYGEIVEPEEASSHQELVQLLGPTRRDGLNAAHPEMSGMTIKILRGKHMGSAAINVLQRSTNILLVLDRGFKTHGTVFSAGPVIAVGDNRFTRILSQSWIDGDRRDSVAAMLDGDRDRDAPCGAPLPHH
jgi:hypothetical protein